MRLAGYLLLAPFVLAQTAPDPVSIKVDVNLVNVAFIVRDGSGSLAAGLSRDDIEVSTRGAIAARDRAMLLCFGNHLRLAVYAVATEKMSKGAGERRAILLFSDGEDNSSAHDLMGAIDAAQKAGAPIYTVRYTESRRGASTARDRYGVREMNRLARDGTFRKVAIRVKRERFVVRAKPEYFAP